MPRTFLDIKILRDDSLQAILNDRRTIDYAFEEAELDFLPKKEQYLEEFKNDPVIESLSNGPRGEDGVVPYGNLSSFIGFPIETDPVSPLLNTLEEGLTMKKTSLFTNYRKDRIDYSFPIDFPSDGELENATPMPSEWSNGSWLFRLEEGLPGFSNYLFDDEEGFEGYSRSTAAIQVKNTMRSAGLIRNDFYTRLITNFKSLFTNIKL